MTPCAFVNVVYPEKNQYYSHQHFFADCKRKWLASKHFEMTLSEIFEALEIKV